LDSVEQRGGGAAGEKGDEHDPAAVTFDGLAFVRVDGFQGVIPALHIDVGSGGIEEADGSDLGEDADGIDATEGGEDAGTVLFGDDGTGGTLELADGVIAIEADEQGIALGAGGFEIGDVAGVKQVEAAVGDHETTPLLAQGIPPRAELGSRQYLGLGRHSAGRLGHASGQVMLPSSRSVTWTDGVS